MRIAMMVRGYICVPRPSDIIYAPIDLAAATAKQLVKRGHQVDFYAPLGSSIGGNVNVVNANLRPLVTDRDGFQELLSDTNSMVHYIPANWEGRLVGEMFKKAARGEYDLLHFHHPEVALQHAASHLETPVVYTLHDPISERHKEIFNLYSSPNQFFVSISDNQRRDAPDLPYIKTVHNGIDIKDYPFSKKSEDYLLFAGRIVPEKGVKEAIQVAKQTNHRLLIIGPVYDDAMGYFNQYIKPKLDEQILYLGYMEQKQLARYYQKAKALLTPVQWEEPFGLTTIEAMASGTPVISFDRGAAPEIIKNNETGFVVKTTAEMIEAVFKVNDISREACRDHVKKNFSTKHMVNGYESAYKQILAERKKLSSLYVKTKLSQLPKKVRDVAQKRRLHKVLESKPKPIATPRNLLSAGDHSR